MNTLHGSRPDPDEYFCRMAELVAMRGTCARRKVGCVIVDEFRHVMATGYNGVYRGAPHCILHNCAGALHPSGQGLHLCQAIHAEQNALLQCKDVTHIHTIYCTASPCVSCMRLIANTSTKRIVFIEEYPHVESRSIARSLGIEWIRADFGIRPDI